MSYFFMVGLAMVNSRELRVRLQAWQCDGTVSFSCLLAFFYCVLQIAAAQDSDRRSSSHLSVVKE